MNSDQENGGNRVVWRPGFWLTLAAFVFVMSSCIPDKPVECVVK